MDDREIVELFWQRDQTAISATSDKYGGYCRTIARNILGSDEDADECLSDTLLGAWNAIPPARPDRLSAFVGRITRNLALDRYRRSHADKRWSGEADAVLDELAEVVSGREDVESEFDRTELVRAMDDFLASLPKDRRVMFVRRYWYSEPVGKLAAEFGTTAAGAAMALKRTRDKLKKLLHERGFEV